MCVRSLLSNQLTETSYIAKNIKKPLWKHIRSQWVENKCAETYTDMEWIMC